MILNGRENFPPFLNSLKTAVRAAYGETHVAAEQLYPADYDFSIIFETVENRKIKHNMERKYTERILWYDEEVRENGRANERFRL